MAFCVTRFSTRYLTRGRVPPHSLPLSCAHFDEGCQSDMMKSGRLAFYFPSVKSRSRLLRNIRTPILFKMSTFPCVSAGAPFRAIFA